jgi:hypothetical protein
MSTSEIRWAWWETLSSVRGSVEFWCTLGSGPLVVVGL